MSGWRKRDPHDGVGVAAKPVPEANLFKGGLTKNLLKMWRMLTSEVLNN
jgi:hypothetical protein